MCISGRSISRRRCCVTARRPRPQRPHRRLNEPVRGTIHDAERELILKQLNESRGNVKNAAARLGISRRTLYRKMQKLGIDYQHLRRRE